MKLSAKTRYAARMLVAMAENDEGESRPISTSTLTDLTGVSSNFIPQILKPFIKNRIVASARGMKGGYYLLCHPKDITFGCIVKLTEEGMELADCHVGEREQCENFLQCRTHMVWRNAHKAMEDALESITLQDLVGRPALEEMTND